MREYRLPDPKDDQPGPKPKTAAPTPTQPVEKPVK